MPHDGKRPRPKTARERTRERANDRMWGYLLAAAAIEWAVANLAVERMYATRESDEAKAQHVMLGQSRRLYERAVEAAATAEVRMLDR